MPKRGVSRYSDEPRSSPTLRFYYDVGEPVEVSSPELETEEANATIAKSIAPQVMAELLRGGQNNTDWRPTIRPSKFVGFPECPHMVPARIELFLVGLDDSERQP